MTRTLVANLDYEFGLQTKSYTPSKALRRRLSKTATVLRVFSPDIVITPFPVDLDWIPENDQFPTPEFRHAMSFPDESSVAYWAQSENPPSERPNTEQLVSYCDAVWHCPRSSPKITQHANDKFFCHTVQRQLGLMLADSKVLCHADELEQLQDYPSWVLKSRFGVAGRNRILGRNYPNDSQLSAIKRMFQHSGSLILEPWVNRIKDYGVTGFISSETSQHIRVHSLKVDNQGTFCGIDTNSTAIDASIASELIDVFKKVAALLINEKYAGPMGIDAFTYLSANGQTKLHALTEINARLTFGHVAQGYDEFLGRPIELNFGRSIPKNVTIIATPDSTDATSCWIS